MVRCVWLVKSRCVPFEVQHAGGKAVQAGFKWLDDGGRIVARSIRVGAVHDGLERGDCRAEIAEPRMDDPRFAPQRHHFRRKHKHAVDHAEGVFGAPGAFMACLDVVLKPDQDIAFADGFVMRRR